MILLLDWLWHRAAVLALGYLVAGQRGALVAVAAREALILVIAALARWSGADRPFPAAPSGPPPA